MSTPAGTRSNTAIDPRTAVGTVHLTVADLGRSRTFYERALGLPATELEADGLAFGPRGARALIELHGHSSAPPLDRRAPGLFHLAILVPSRLDLALALARLVQAKWPLDGASDHLVSEALYLSDPDGNGIEIYRDRPRADWPRAGGTIQMATLALDLHSLAGELADQGSTQPEAPIDTRVGHVHLQVSELERTEAFYSGGLGFDATVRAYPGALFVSAGGYHHHIGLNTWHSAGSGPPPPGSVGLRYFEVELPAAAALDASLERATAFGIHAEPIGDGHMIRDPSGNGVLLRSR